MIPLDAAILLLFFFTLPVAAFLHLSSWTFHLLSRRYGWIPKDKISWIDKKWLVWTSSGVLGVYALCGAYGAKLVHSRKHT